MENTRNSGTSERVVGGRRRCLNEWIVFCIIARSVIQDTSRMLQDTDALSNVPANAFRPTFHKGDE